MRDTNRDGKPDVVAPFGDVKGTEVRLFKNWLYVSDDVGVYRYSLKKGQLAPNGARETVVSDFPKKRQHSDKTFALEQERHSLYQRGRAFELLPGKRSAGRFARQESVSHSGEVRRRLGVRRPEAQPDPGQRQALRHRHAQRRGHRMECHAERVVRRDSWPRLAGHAFPGALQLGRQRHAAGRGVPPDRRWRRLRLAVPLLRYQAGQASARAGVWRRQDEGTRAGKYPDPLVAFPAHWAPNDLLFYSGKSFPAKYHEGAFIAFHGSWNRAPEPQAGYKVVFQPMKDGKPNGPYEIFADGFAGEMQDNNPRNAQYRPVGLAVGPDGSLFVSDSQKGRIWRISFGKK